MAYEQIAAHGFLSAAKIQQPLWSWELGEHRRARRLLCRGWLSFPALPLHGREVKMGSGVMSATRSVMPGQRLKPVGANHRIIEMSLGRGEDLYQIPCSPQASPAGTRFIATWSKRTQGRRVTQRKVR